MAATTFAEAMGGVSAPTPTPQTPTPAAPTTTPASIGTDGDLVDPRDGQIIDVGQAPDTQLVDVVLECRRREGLEQTWRKACEDELRRRMGDRKLWVVGDHELKLELGRGKEWDARMLRGVVQHLIEEGVLPVGEIPEGLFKPMEVNGNAANRILDRLQGEHQEMVAECFRWVQKSRPRLTVNPVPDLADALPKGTNGT
jgi:hypothetical protein